MFAVFESKSHKYERIRPVIDTIVMMLKYQSAHTPPFWSHDLLWLLFVLCCNTTELPARMMIKPHWKKIIISNCVFAKHSRICDLRSKIKFVMSVIAVRSNGHKQIKLNTNGPQKQQHLVFDNKRKYTILNKNHVGQSYQHISMSSNSNPSVNNETTHNPTHTTNC